MSGDNSRECKILGCRLNTDIFVMENKTKLMNSPHDYPCAKYEGCMITIKKLNH